MQEQGRNIELWCGQPLHACKVLSHTRERESRVDATIVDYARVVRHGETEDNKTRTIAGHNAGKLSALGVTQAQALAARFRGDGVAFDAVYSSDLARTRQTTELVLPVLPPTTPVYYDARLREKGAGSIEGKPLGTAEKMARKSKVSMREFRPPGGESWRDVAVRSQSFVRDIATIFAVGGRVPGREGGGRGRKGGGTDGLVRPLLALKSKKGADVPGLGGAGRSSAGWASGSRDRRAVPSGAGGAGGWCGDLLGFVARKASPMPLQKDRQRPHRLALEQV